MRLENKHDLPETIARAIIKTNDRYDAGAVDASVTQLIQPPRINLLRKLHYKDMVRDLSEELYAVLGSGIHHLLEIGATANMVVEERLFLTIDGWRISGAIDVQEFDGNEVDIIDYKVTSTYSVTKTGDVKEEWLTQLNLQALLVEQNKPEVQVRSLSIMAFLRDWSSSTAQRDPMYPQAPLVKVPIPLWSRQKQLAYARERIALHRKARFDHNMGEELDHCTTEDRWVRDEKWVVMKKGGKRALKTFGNPVDALELAQSKGKDYHVVYRPGKSTRCGFCGVSQFCSQYRDIIAKEEANDDDPSIPSQEE